MGLDTAVVLDVLSTVDAAVEGEEEAIEVGKEESLDALVAAVEAMKKQQAKAKAPKRQQQQQQGLEFGRVLESKAYHPDSQPYGDDWGFIGFEQPPEQEKRQSWWRQQQQQQEGWYVARSTMTTYSDYDFGGGGDDYGICDKDCGWCWYLNNWDSRLEVRGKGDLTITLIGSDVFQVFGYTS